MALNRKNEFGMMRAMLSALSFVLGALTLCCASRADDFPEVADKSLAKLLGEQGRLAPKLYPFDDTAHVAWKLSSEGLPVAIPAEIQCLSQKWMGVRNAQMPYMVYMREKDRLLILFERNEPTGRPALTHSDDRGATWSKPRWLQDSVAGKPGMTGLLGLTYLGAGKLIAYPEDVSTRVLGLSSDFGETWEVSGPSASDGVKYSWNPLLERVWILAIEAS